MALRTCPVDGCGRTMRTSVTVLLVGRDGAEYKRVCQACARKASRILPAAVARACKSCGEYDPTMCGACTERYAAIRLGTVGLSIACRIRAAADAYEGAVRARNAFVASERAAALAHVAGMRSAADMAEAADRLPERSGVDGTEEKPAG